VTNNKDKENPKMCVYLRNIFTNAHQIIQRNQVIASKKISNLEAGNEVSYDQRGSRIRGIILVIVKQLICLQK
jgi:hypothetical protein